MELLLERKLIGFIWIFNVTFKNISVFSGGETEERNKQSKT
jgi:hypothetical protein